MYQKMYKKMWDESEALHDHASELHEQYLEGLAMTVKSKLREDDHQHPRSNQPPPNSKVGYSSFFLEQKKPKTKVLSSV